MKAILIWLGLIDKPLIDLPLEQRLIAIWLTRV